MRKKIKAKVDKDMEIINRIILENIKPISIILFGSFSRYEGFFEIKKNKISPLNDYDLYLVTNKKLSDDFLEELGMKCSKALGKGGLEYAEFPDEKYDKNKYFHVDLRSVSLKDLKKPLPTIRSFDLKNAKVIYGEDVLKEMPDVNISFPESIRYLFNKMCHLVLSKDTDNLYKTIHIVKAYTDLCTSLLVCENKLVVGYENRNKVFNKLNYPKELIDKVNWATKTRLDFKPLKNTEKEWERAVYWIGFALKKILIENLNLKKNDWKNVIKSTYKKLPYVYFKPYLRFNLFLLQYYLNIKYVLNCWKNKEYIIRPLFRWRDAGLILGIVLMNYLYNSKDTERYFKKITKNTQPLKVRILKLYALYYYQRLI